MQGIVQLVELAQPPGAGSGPCPNEIGVVLGVNAALDHVRMKSDAEKIFLAVLGKLDAILQAPGVQLFVGAGCCPGDRGRLSSGRSWGG